MAWSLAPDILRHGRERWLLKCACAVQCQAAATQLVIRNSASLINNSYHLDNWLALETVVASTKQRMRQPFWGDEHCNGTYVEPSLGAMPN